MLELTRAPYPIAPRVNPEPFLCQHLHLLLKMWFFQCFNTIVSCSTFFYVLWPEPQPGGSQCPLPDVPALPHVRDIYVYSCLSVLINLHQSIYLSIFLSISIYLSIHPSIYLSIYLSMGSIYIFMYLCIYIYIYIYYTYVYRVQSIGIYLYSISYTYTCSGRSRSPADRSEFYIHIYISCNQ